MQQQAYHPNNKVRIVTAASLFDGHDAAINIMRRVLQQSGAEVIHLGHDRSVQEIVNCAIQEDVQGIAISSYQGGHMEFFKYMYDLLKEANCSHIKIVGGGGGVILPEEIKELHKYGITRIFSPDDGRKLGLQGMINEAIKACDFPLPHNIPNSIEALNVNNWKLIAELISLYENQHPAANDFYSSIQKRSQSSNTPILGVTGTGGAGKSSLVDEIIRRFLLDFPDKHLAVISVDPSRKKSGGALLGDRIRMNAINNPRVYMRSLATRQSNISLSSYIDTTLDVVKAAGFDLIILETSGIGQSDTQITDHCDVSMYVMTPDYGAASQLEKIDMLDYADIIALNKFDKMGALDALQYIKKQYQRNHMQFDTDIELMPVFGTIASQYNDPGVDHFYYNLIHTIENKLKLNFQSHFHDKNTPSIKQNIIPVDRTRYLSEITKVIRDYNIKAEEQANIAAQIQSLKETQALLHIHDYHKYDEIDKLIKELQAQLELGNGQLLNQWDDLQKKYNGEVFSYFVRGKEVIVSTTIETLSHLQIPKIAFPKYSSHKDRLRWLLLENVPGKFPFAAGVYPYKREYEDPIRMFAGEGCPERTNRRFHYVSKGQKAKRLSTAYDSVTLYGRDPDIRPDIYGKVGNAGVSVCCLDDSKKLYSGFDLTDALTSVSMTINGPAPTLVAYFLNTAIDQECEKYIRKNGMVDNVKTQIEQLYKEKNLDIPTYYGDIPESNDKSGLLLLGVPADKVIPTEVYQNIKAETLKAVRGTVQADILKEDQAQNTCIFSTDFSLKLMGDVQEYFIQNHVRNFYSVSISGYHIAEAGANPITQLAFTLANGFTYVEYYISRGMDINHFAPNLSFFFSNGIDPEYSVLGRVARIIWAKAMKLIYNADERSQKLKYHIQTSGRSLHAQEIEFNDIRTTLQALSAIYDNCNSLHTNAFDEAITTPTEESVRRAMAIQMIINKEFGLTKNQNPLQGSFIIEELTNLVEEAVLCEFDRITARGGVLGAMESMYQRSKIQEESMYYEILKHSGKLPIVGVNTYLSSKGSPTIIPTEVIRATQEEKDNQLNHLNTVHKIFYDEAIIHLEKLKELARQDKNVFEGLMEATKYCSLGQITDTLFSVGGQYRRNM
ncbi:MAG: methylmalonyl-CoA mutase family protein [Hyphomicrobiales bacterium]